MLILGKEETLFEQVDYDEFYKELNDSEFMPFLNRFEVKPLATEHIEASSHHHSESLQEERKSRQQDEASVTESLKQSAKMGSDRFGISAKACPTDMSQFATSMVDSSDDSENENGDESDGGVSGESENAEDSSEEIEELLPMVQILLLEKK